jgi:DNA-binding transcriptional LysR family regulator
VRARLLEELARCRVTRLLAGLDVAAGQAPCPGQCPLPPFDNEDVIAAEDDDARGGARPFRSLEGFNGHGPSSQVAAGLGKAIEPRGIARKDLRDDLLALRPFRNEAQEAPIIDGMIVDRRRLG